MNFAGWREEVCGRAVGGELGAATRHDRYFVEIWRDGRSRRLVTIHPNGHDVNVSYHDRERAEAAAKRWARRHAGDVNAGWATIYDWLVLKNNMRVHPAEPTLPQAFGRIVMADEPGIWYSYPER